LVVGDARVAFLRSAVSYPEAEIVLAGRARAYALRCDTYVQYFAVDWDATTLLAVAPVDDRWAVGLVPISEAG
jgi:hypothetical protein